LAGKTFEPYEWNVIGRKYYRTYCTLRRQHLQNGGFYQLLRRSSGIFFARKSVRHTNSRYINIIYIFFE
jgi:hypothetical protein